MLNVENLSMQFMDMLTDFIDIGPKLPEDTPLSKVMQLEFGYVPTGEKWGGRKHRKEALFDSVRSALITFLDQRCGGRPKTPTAVLERYKEYKKYQLRFKIYPTFTVYKTTYWWQGKEKEDWGVRLYMECLLEKKSADIAGIKWQ